MFLVDGGNLSFPRSRRLCLLSMMSEVFVGTEGYGIA